MQQQQSAGVACGLIRGVVITMTRVDMEMDLYNNHIS